MIAVGIVALSLIWVIPGRRRVRVRREKVGYIDVALLADLAGAALLSGSSLPGMLRAVAQALVGMRVSGVRTDPARLDEVANMLLMGASWEEAWQDVPGFNVLEKTLAASWVDGAAPLPLLDRAAVTIRLTRQRRAKEAAAKLGAALVMPLGLCFLPAFVLLGVVPVVVGAATTLF
ncbi:MAG: type II secretion system F family protein [Actinomycetaceae bacterium]|nr:type II secretion system F family protein [Actinomycetaceae bacterium]